MNRTINFSIKAGGIGLMLLLMVTLTGFSGCRAGLSRPEATLPPAYPAWSEKEMQALEQASAEVPGQNRQDRADTLVRLAMFYSHEDNPAPDLDRAVNCLEEALGLKAVSAVNAACVVGLLKRLKQCRAESKTALVEFNRKISQLDERCRTLRQDNQAKTEIIEKLKHLDIRLENRRGAFE
ncbi:MAG: hypothetical protein ACLFS7_02970 [Desulfosudaceae bacterium]